MDRRAITDDEVAAAALKLMGYEWDKSYYTESTCLWKISRSNGAKFNLVMPKTLTATELYEYISSLK